MVQRSTPAGQATHRLRVQKTPNAVGRPGGAEIQIGQGLDRVIAIATALIATSRKTCPRRLREECGR
ncbi:hypothetical protein D3C71_1815580 [compost metagenome]